jgi:hypothetical protein
MRKQGHRSSTEVDGKVRQFNRVLMSYVDFHQAACIAEAILSAKLHDRLPSDRFLLEGLNAGMIVAYARPFSGNDKGAKVKVPDLPNRILKGLTLAERELHGAVIKDRNQVVAHSDSRAWNPRPHYQRLPGGHEVLVPLFDNPHAPLTRDATAALGVLAGKLMEFSFEERTRLESELRPFIQVVEHSDVEVRGTAKRLGIKWPR